MKGGHHGQEEEVLSASEGRDWMKRWPPLRQPAKEA